MREILVQILTTNSENVKRYTSLFQAISYTLLKMQIYGEKTIFCAKQPSSLQNVIEFPCKKKKFIHNEIDFKCTFLTVSKAH